MSKRDKGLSRLTWGQRGKLMGLRAAHGFTALAIAGGAFLGGRQAQAAAASLTDNEILGLIGQCPITSEYHQEVEGLTYSDGESGVIHLENGQEHLHAYLTSNLIEGNPTRSGGGDYFADVENSAVYSRSEAITTSAPSISAADLLAYYGWDGDPSTLYDTVSSGIFVNAIGNGYGDEAGQTDPFFSLLPYYLPVGSLDYDAASGQFYVAPHTSGERGMAGQVVYMYEDISPLQLFGSCLSLDGTSFAAPATASAVQYLMDLNRSLAATRGITNPEKYTDLVYHAILVTGQPISSFAGNAQNRDGIVLNLTAAAEFLEWIYDNNLEGTHYQSAVYNQSELTITPVYNASHQMIGYDITVPMAANGQPINPANIMMQYDFGSIDNRPFSVSLTAPNGSVTTLRAMGDFEINPLLGDGFRSSGVLRAGNPFGQSAPQSGSLTFSIRTDSPITNDNPFDINQLQIGIQGYHTSDRLGQITGDNLYQQTGINRENNP